MVRVAQEESLVWSVEDGVFASVADMLLSAGDFVLSNVVRTDATLIVAVNTAGIYVQASIRWVTSGGSGQQQYSLLYTCIEGSLGFSTLVIPRHDVVSERIDVKVLR